MTEEDSKQETKRFCLCGCGQEVKGFNHSKWPYEPTKFVKGHNQSKERHWQWHGGRKLNAAGYVMIQCKGHPRATKEGYVFEHDLIMEQIIGRYLQEGEFVHHKNENKQDNRPENLQLVTKAEHNSIHHKGKPKKKRNKK